MAQRPPSPSAGNLRLRLLSALVLAPPFFAAIYVGSPWFDAIIVIAAVLMVWEWTRICFGGVFVRTGWVMETGTLAALVVLYLGMPEAALAVIGLFAVGLFVIARSRGHEAPARVALGALLIGLFAVSFLWIRDFPESGREFMIWLVIAVWFTDTGGYFFGRAIGGPKLAPRISPNKTWAGLGGGILLAAIWSEIWLSWLGERGIFLVAGAAVAIAVLAQLGDLSVSAVKRRFGVKDASDLIPGHGGVLDRLDGMLLTGPAAAFVLVLSSKGLI